MSINRRDYLKGLATIGAGLALTSMITSKNPLKLGYSRPTQATSNSVLYGGSTIRRSVCLMCHGGCGIEGYVHEGNLIQIRGNPYHPNAAIPNIDYTTDPSKITTTGRVCAKGRSGPQHLYDPNRIKHPLKRVGPRGSGKWKVISWEQALDEIVNGAELEDKNGNTYKFTGLKDLYNHTDPANPDDPILGPVANQVIFTIGRSEHGRKEVSQRLWRDGFGTWNYQNDHTSICELSHHIAYKMVTGKSHLKPDIEHVEYVMWFGTRPLEANFPFSPFAHKIIDAVVERDPQLKMVVVDPTLTKAADKAYRWVPIKPGTDAAFAMGLIRVMIENGWYNKDYLENANEAAATDDDYPSHTNAAYLVDTTTGQLVKQNDNPVVVAKGTTNQVEVTGSNAIEGELEPNVGATIRTGFELLKAEAFSKTLEQWSAICEVDPDLITKIAKEFYQHAPKAVADFYRGPVQSTNGFYNGVSIITLNLLVGNVNMVGGLHAGGGHWQEMGGKAILNPDGSDSGKTTLDLKNSFGSQAKNSPQGISIGRDYGNISYEDTQEFQNNGYPAKRPWFPLTSNVWQEVFAGIAEGYPYKAKALITHMANPTYSMPAVSGKDGPLEQVLKDTDKLPLFIAVDCFMGETTSLADYILPDVTYLERFASPHVAPSITVKTSGIRQPVLGEYDPNARDANDFPGGTDYKLYPDTYMAEDIYIQLARRIKTGKKATKPDEWLPGFGPDGLGKDDNGNDIPLETAWDWYKQIILNIAKDGIPVLPRSDYNSDEEWDNALIQYILARGGRFDQYIDSNGNYTHIDPNNPKWLKSKATKTLNLYMENVGTTINVMTGQRFKGTPHYEEVKYSDGTPVYDDNTKNEYPFLLITFKRAYHTQSRTAAVPYLMGIQTENYIEINTEDANRLGIQTGDEIKIVSKTNPEGVVGKALVKPGIKPGVIGVSHNYGHWAYGASKWNEDSLTRGGDKYIGTGVQSNFVMLQDKIGSVGLTDLVGGSCAFYNTPVKIIKV